MWVEEVYFWNQALFSRYIYFIRKGLGRPILFIRPLSTLYANLPKVQHDFQHSFSFNDARHDVHDIAIYTLKVKHKNAIFFLRYTVFNADIPKHF